MTGRRPAKVIIDCDPGIDDSLALMLALESPELDVLAVTVVAGNVGLRHCARNARGVIALMAAHGRRAVPLVADGADRPLSRVPIVASHVHGHDGLAGLSGLLPAGGGAVEDSMPAEEAILAVASAHPGEVTLITLGPMTNAALALRRDAAAFRQLAGIVTMGGAFGVHGNVTAAAEFNIHADPHAANDMLERGGVPVRMVGLDITTRVVLQGDRLRSMTPGPRDSARELAHRICDFYGGFYRERGVVDGCYLHDPMAVGAVIDPTLVRYEPMRVAIETTGDHTSGMTLVDRRPWSEAPHTAQVAVDADAERFLDLFVSRVLA